MFKRLTHTFLILLLSLNIVSGQTNTYQTFKNINLGYEALVACCFIQDASDLIWVGTDKGLMSYDGYSSRQHFNYGEKNNTRINCGIAIDDTYLYLGADNGILIYNYKTDRYEDIGTIFPTDVRALALQDTILWIGSLNGLYTYNLTTKEVLSLDKQTYNLPHHTIYSILKTQNNEIFIGTYNGLCAYNPERKKVEQLSLPVSGDKSNQFVNILLEDTVRNCIWIGTEGDLFVYVNHHDYESIERIPILNNNSVKALELDEENNLLIGTDNGLYIYNEHQPLQHIMHDSRNIQSLSNNIIWSIFSDKEKNLWFGTDYGISLAGYNKTFQFIHLSQITGTGDGNHLYAMYKDKAGNYWFGGTNGVIQINDLSTKNSFPLWYKMGDKKHPLPHNRIRHIYEDKDRNLWLATDGSINRYDYSKQEFKQYTIIDSTGTYNSNWAYYLFEDNKGQLWIATCLGGIFVINKGKLINSTDKLYKAEYNLTTENGLSGMTVNRIIPDHEGNVWVLLYNNGLNKVDAKTFQITTIPIEKSTGVKHLNYIICDNSGIIWLGYRGGVIRINPKDNNIQKIHFNEFSNHEVLSMIEVDQYIWVSTADGVWTVNKKSLDIKRINTTNKLFTSLYYNDEDKLVFMGSIDGFAVTSPLIVNDKTTEKPINITSLYINNQLLQSDIETHGHSIRYANTIHLKHFQNQLAFDISDLPYSSKEKSTFVYKMSGVDQEGNYLKQNTNRISYSNLNFGNYTLLISKLDDNGNPSPRHYSLNLHISPPWYLTWWAKAIYWLLAISLIVWTINFIRVKRRLKAERVEKEMLLKQSQEKIDLYTGLLEETKKDAIKFKSIIRQKLEDELKAKARLERLTAPKEVEIVSHDEKFLSHITQIIEERIADPDLNVNSLCDAAGVNNKQLYRKIKQLTNTTPVEYIKTIRMKKAAMLLAQKKLTVAEVMYMVGYSNHSYFSKCFQSEFGKTPRQYMEEDTTIL